MENEYLSAEVFLASLSHELRTPLNGIVGYTQLLLNSKLNSVQRSYINSMNHCCISLVEIINDVLDFSKLATGKMAINNECITFKELIEDVNETIGFRIKEKKQKCQYVLSKDLPNFIITDRHKLIQIMINIMSNANKYTQIGGRIIVHILPCDENTIEFSIEDDGIGISIENQGRLFDAFFQVKESTSKSGSGLGLAISKKLIELMGGNISVESELGHGSVFTFSIKYEPYDDFKREVEKNSACLHNKHVLIVDGDVENRVFISDILFESGMNPITCGSAREALDLVFKNRYPFSIGLIDICIPDITGTELAEKLKQIAPEMPLVGLSSLDEIPEKREFDVIIDKPMHKLKLLDCIIKLIGKQDISSCILQPSTNVAHEPIIAKKQAQILIAEDVSYNMNMLIKMLQGMGYYNIDTAINGEQCIEKLDFGYEKSSPYDILLLDLKMPNIDGFGVLEHLQARAYIYPKVAVLTASVLDKDKEKCKSFNVKYFILKPINMTHLRMVMKQLSSETEPRIIKK